MSKLAIITGADGGMGTEITRAVAQAGYHVIMLCYTLFKGEERKNQLILETGNKEIEVRQVDLSSMASLISLESLSPLQSESKMNVSTCPRIISPFISLPAICKTPSYVDSYKLYHY